MKTEKVLITGITGMVGSHLLDYLIDNTDWEIYGMLRWRSPLVNIAHHIPRINSKERIKLVYADLRDTMSVEHAVITSKPKYVFHLDGQGCSDPPLFGLRKSRRYAPVRRVVPAETSGGNARVRFHDRAVRRSDRWSGAYLVHCDVGRAQHGRQRIREKGRHRSRALHDDVF